MPRIVCPSCRKKLRLPDQFAGRRVMCPRCDEVLVVPTELVKVVEDAGTTEETSPPEEDLPFPKPARWGIIALVLGMISTFMKCVPWINYVAIGLSGLGLLLGLSGLYRARTDSQPLPPSVASGAGICAGFGTRVRDYPLAGVVACLFSLLLNMWPLLIEWFSEMGP